MVLYSRSIERTCQADFTEGLWRIYMGVPNHLAGQPKYHVHPKEERMEMAKPADVLLCHSCGLLL